MNRRCRQLLTTVILMLTMAVSFAAVVFASDDNSLADLGIKTPGVTVSPEFKYDIWEYDVEVPAGTTELELAPHTTNPSATVNSVEGTTLTDGAGTVVITVTSESGNAIEYILNVTQARGAVDPAEAIAANEGTTNATLDTEVVLQSEVETEDPRYVKVDRNSLEDAEKTIEKLQKTITEQRNHISMMTYVLYGLIAVSVVFLFIVISQLLRRRDMAQELALYRQSDPYRSGDGYVAEDGWGEWGEDEVDRSHKKKGKRQEPVEDDWDDEPANGSGWANEQIGTPMQPQRHAPKSYPQGDQRNPRKSKKSNKSRQNNDQQPRQGGNGQRQGGNSQRPSGNNQRMNGGQRQGGNNQRPNGNTQRIGGSTQRINSPQRQNSGNLKRQNTGSLKRQNTGNLQRQNTGNQQMANGQPRPNNNNQRSNNQQRQGNYDETRRYQAVQPVHQNEVPKDVTKDLSRMNKAEQKALKKAAVAEAKREEEARRAAQAREAEAKRQEEARRAAQAREAEAKRQEEARRAAQARDAEAKRQAMEAERIAREQAVAREAQEQALRQAAAQRAQQEAEARVNAAEAAGQAAAEKDKNVKIDMIDL